MPFTAEERKKLGPLDFGPSTITPVPAAQPGPVARVREFVRGAYPELTAAEQQRRAAVAAAPTIGTKFHESVAGLPSVVTGFAKDTFGPVARDIGQFGYEAITGKPAAMRAQSEVAAPTATPPAEVVKVEVPAAAATVPAPKLGLPRDFEGQLGSFDISQEGGVQVIRGPAIARAPSQEGAGVISPLDMAKYNIDRVNLARNIANDARTADKDATAQAMDLARFIQNDDTLGEMRPTAQRLALTFATPEKPPLFIASLISELVPQLTETDPVARQKQLQEMLVEKLAMAQVQP